jgi:hypothetical protein
MTVLARTSSNLSDLQTPRILTLKKTISISVESLQCCAPRILGSQSYSKFFFDGLSLKLCDVIAELNKNKINLPLKNEKSYDL